MNKKNCSDWSKQGCLPFYDRPTNQQTDDHGGNKEVSILVMYNSEPGYTNIHCMDIFKLSFPHPLYISMSPVLKLLIS